MDKLLILVIRLQLLLACSKQSNSNEADRLNQSPKVGLVALQKLGRFSHSPSSIRGLTGWRLEDLGSNLVLIEHTIKAAASTWGFENLNTTFNTIQQKASINEPWDSLHWDANQTSHHFKNYLRKYRPMLDEKTNFAGNLVEKYRSLIAAMSVSFDINSLEPVEPSFLLELVDAQRQHLADDLTFHQVKSLLLDKELIKEANRHLDHEMLRYSIKAHISQREKEEELRRNQSRSELYTGFIQDRKFNFPTLGSLNLCAINITKCDESIITGTQSNDAVGKKKRDAEPWCFGQYCLKEGFHNNSFTWIKEPHNDHRPLNFRKKRFIFLAAMAIIALVASISASVYVAAEISGIHKAIGTTNKALEESVKQISVAKEDIIILNQKVNGVVDSSLQSLSALNETMLNIEILRFEDEISAVLESLEEHLVQAEFAFNDLRSRKFPHSIVTLTEVKNLYKELQEHAHKHKQDLMLSHFTSIYQCESHLLQVDGQLHIYINIPIMAATLDGEEFSLYTIPTSHGVLLNGTSWYFRDPQNDYAAINTAGTLYKPLSQYQVDACVIYYIHSQAYYHCSHEYSVYQNNVQDSCMMQLYRGSHGGATMRHAGLVRAKPNLGRVCDLTITTLQDYVAQLDRNHFLLYSKHDDAVHIRCPMKQPDTKPFRGVYNLTLPSGCEATTNSHTLYTAFDSVYHSSHELVYRRIDFSAFFDTQDNSFENNLDIIRNHLESIKHTTVPEINLDKARALIKEAEEQNHPFFWFTSQKWTILFVLAGITSFITIATCACYSYKKLRARRRRALIRAAVREQAPERNDALALMPLGQ